MTHTGTSDGKMIFMKKYIELLWICIAISAFSQVYAAQYLEKQGPLRGRLILNGEWQCKPAFNEDGDTTNGTWGKIWVPGSYNGRNHFPGISKEGFGPAWNLFTPQSARDFYYKKNITIPPSWLNRSLKLHLEGLNAYAKIYANGKYCGDIAYPFGSCDITAAAKGSGTIDLVIFTHADDDPDTRYPYSIARGLIGEVFLTSMPAAPRVDTLVIETSVRNDLFTLHTTLTGLTTAGTVTLTPHAYTNGILAREFSPFNASVSALAETTVSHSWSWTDPLLWDVGQPNLYDLHLSVQGCGIDDVYYQRFGFREFWIEGRECYLNGTPFRMRPVLALYESARYGSVFGFVDAIDGILNSFLWAGFNITELWPNDEDEIGMCFFRDVWYERADEIGMPVMGNNLHVNNYLNNWPAVSNTYNIRMKKHLDRYRHHPSIILWISSGNAGFSTAQDQNPLFIGNRSFLETSYDTYAYGTQMVEMVKAYDPTRPVTTHHGGSCGDIQTCNNYLDILPLQEREEWLSCWRTNGTIPYSGIEFGTPLDCTVFRARDNCPGAYTSEPLMTEFCTIYQGAHAYTQEPETYRDFIANKFNSGMAYNNMQESPEIIYTPAFQSLLELFVRNTYRSWRTMGMTAGILPWAYAHGWRIDTFNSTTNFTFHPGQRGTFYSTFQNKYIAGLKPPYVELYPSAITLMEANGPTLAWIAGPENAFTEKNHNFFTDMTVNKSIALLNDSREECTYSCQWTVTNDGVHIASGVISDTAIPVGTTVFENITFSTRSSLSKSKTEGAIYLDAEIGTNRHTDIFPFRVFFQ